jgi:pyruvate,water dikinase
VAVTDLYDDERAPGTRWTRVNIGEAIPGVPTPLSWSLWRPAMEHAFWWSQEQLGVVGRHDPRPRVTGIALGRPVVSVDVSIAQVARMPGYDPDAFAEQYFGLAPTGPPTPTTTSPALLARVGGKAPAALVRLGRRVERSAAESERWWSGVVGGHAPADPVALLLECRRHFVDAMAIHTLVGMLCQGAYERASALAGELAPRIVSTDGALAEARVAADLWAVAHGALAMDAFVGRHGFHGPNEGELLSPSWREDPAPVLAAAEGWAGAAVDQSPDAAAARRTADRVAAQEELLGRLSRARRPGAHVLLAAARRLIGQREVGKAAFLRHLDAARFAARALGSDAMWCTLEELQLGTRPADAELTRRQARRDELLSLELPLSWVGDPEPLADSMPSPPEPAGAVVVGLGASPGVVRGRARVVIDPTRLGEPIGPDEVLVARTTDPSWVTLFLTAGALVIDVGGPLSHGAIIARELGVPCVIGTGDGTTRIAEGADVVVDGTTGTVTIA